MSRHYSIWIVTPPGYGHSGAFNEIAVSLRAAFKALGYDAPIVTSAGAIKDWAIVLGCNLLPMLGGKLPDKLILYNMEQIQKEQSVWLQPAYIELLRHYPVWDYSERNITRLKEDFGITGVALCGVGYMAELSAIPTAEKKDIDVLFIGSMNERRLNVLKQIAASGKHVEVAYNKYGKDRDAMIARAKVHLNLHYYEAQVFEIVRVSYLLANRQCVVSETGHDSALETPLKGGVAFAPYQNIANACVTLAEKDDMRLLLAEQGFKCFEAQSQVPMLERALKSIAN